MLKNVVIFLQYLWVYTGCPKKTGLWSFTGELMQIATLGFLHIKVGSSGSVFRNFHPFRLKNRLSHKQHFMRGDRPPAPRRRRARAELRDGAADQVHGQVFPGLLSRCRQLLDELKAPGRDTPAHAALFRRGSRSSSRRATTALASAVRKSSVCAVAHRKHFYQNGMNISEPRAR